ncbi:MAG: hypothetical protein AAGB22_04885, partial [Bacteroidota bacterium]
FRINAVADGPYPGTPFLFFTSPDAVDFFNDATLLKEARVYYAYDCNGTSAKGTTTSNQLVTATTTGNYRIDITGGLSLSNGCFHTLDPSKSGYMRFRLKKAYGGGIRVSSMRYVEPDHDEEYRLDFEYGQGQATQDPGRFAYAFNQTLRPTLSTTDRLAMAPNVGYSRVKVVPKGIITPATEAEAVNIGGVLYTFENWPDHFGMGTDAGARFAYNSGYTVITYKHIKQFTEAALYRINAPGRLDSIVVFDSAGNYLSITDHHYGISEHGPQRGSIGESFYLVSSETGENTTVETVYSLHESHDYLVKITHEEGDFKTTTKFSDFDRYTGIAGRTDVESNATGSFHTERKLAYLTYPELGPKTLNPANENRLSVNYETKTGRAPVSRSYTTWDDDYMVRALNGSGAYATTTVTSGEWLPNRSYRNNGQADQALWEPINNPTLFDAQLNLLEGKDPYGRYSAMKRAGKHQLTVASASLSNYASFFHCGFEYVASENGVDHFENEITKGQQQQAKITSPVAIQPHTGDYMAEVPGGAWGPDYRLERQTATVNGETVEQGLLPGRTYEASVWVHNQSDNTARLSMMLNGMAAGAPVSQHVSVSKGDGGHLTVGNWTLMRVTLTVPENFTTPGTGDELVVFCHNYDGEDVAYFDDFRFQPIDATVEAVVYDQRRQLPLFVIGNENFYIRLEYDAAGNSVRSFQETESGEKKLRETTTHFAN